jgi:GT2 family glycosyltransferase
MYVIRFLGLKRLVPSPIIRRRLALSLRPILGDVLVSHLNPGEPYSDKRAIEYLSAAALLVRRSLVEQIGGLDDSYFMYLEDVDWCIRMRQAGWKLAFVPAVVATHYSGASYKGNGSSSSFRSDHPESYKSIIRYLRKHHTATSRVIVILVITISLLGRSMLAGFSLFGGRRVQAANFIKNNLRNIRTVWLAQ